MFLPNGHLDFALWLTVTGSHKSRHGFLNVITSPPAQGNLAKELYRAYEDDEPLNINSIGERWVVILQLDDFIELQETPYLLQRPVKAEGLFSAV